MLNNKLVKAFLLSATLFIILAAVRANSPSQPADSTLRPVTDSIQWLSFDASLLKLSGIPDSGVTDIPSIDLHRQASPFVKDYLAKNGYMLKKIKEAYPSYFTIMDSVFSRYELPSELKYLAIVESRLKVNSVSRAGAVGPWQLMPVAARLYSLKVSPKYDERRHFYKSTVAAARLLKDLHERFGDWLLVVAAYNSGPGGVYKAIKKAGSRNYWKLQQFLPLETRKHVKKFISTHYYYEQQGSIATVTKDEADMYRKKMMDFVEKQNKILKDKMTAAAPVTAGAEEKIITIPAPGDTKVSQEK